MDARPLLDPCAAAVRETPGKGRFTDRRGGVAPDRRALCHRNAIEKTVRGSAQEARLAVRRELSAPIIEAFRPWLEAQLSHIPKSSKLAEDIRYTLTHWSGLIRFLEDGRLELDTKPPAQRDGGDPLARSST